MNNIFTKQFWLDATERAVKTGAQAIVLFWGAGELFDLFSVDWQATGGFFLGGVALSILTSVISAPFANQGTASLTRAVETSR